MLGTKKDFGFSYKIKLIKTQYGLIMDSYVYFTLIDIYVGKLERWLEHWLERRLELWQEH